MSCSRCAVFRLFLFPAFLISSDVFFQLMDPDILNDSKLTVREKAALLNVSVGTVFNKLHNLHTKANGGLTKFSADEEAHIEELLLQCAEFGVPLNTQFLLKVLISVGKDKGKKTSFRNSIILGMFFFRLG